MQQSLEKKSTSGSYFAGFVQLDVRLGAIEENIAAVRKGLKDLRPSSPGMVVLPELWATGFDYENLSSLAVKTPEVLQAVQDLAAEHKIIIAGSLPEHEDGFFYNTLYLVDAGGLIGSFRKQHLFPLMEEEKHFSRGFFPRPISTELGLIACLVCYDLRFPDLARSQVAQGAALLVLSGQWPEARKDHWLTLARARAIENQVYVIACNRCGKTGSTTFAGNSMIIAPDGSILVEAGKEETALGAQLSQGFVEEVRNRFNTVSAVDYSMPDREKISSVETVCAVMDQYRKIGRSVVFTNGCFDILHQGHVTYLEAARRQGSCLVVGLNSDKSVQSIKGPTRPVNRQESRARVLAALGCVDHVVIFDDDTPLNLITRLKPDVLVKGADWPLEKIVGAKEVIEGGGKVVNIPLVADFSTTEIIRKMQGN
ncbi:MAG: D-glycero-beta-D-manno-heptose 1-phosphate adenylyltransferase [Proteobacteria bacterium]|nr:D-glycero-beta-D-manno-heptose 1-phosphate adenylyltransferase [Pseudomonadota bacterium]MBU1708541.1 D-glycero-beta-D-manno-heptose 1-phosphate adenylyltransferase [Pseudomonadota bacterium]